MVGMGMRHGDVTDVRRFDSDLVELRGERLRLAPHQRGAGSDLTSRQGGDLIGNASVPQQIALGVVHQVAIVDDVERHAHVDSGRPARLIARVPLSTVEDVQSIEA